MKLFELIYGIIIIILLIIYFTLCSNTEINIPNHIHKFKISKIINDSYENKINNLYIDIIATILTILIITYELNYISHNFNSNIYVRCIQLIITFIILLLIYIPNYYNNIEYNKLSNIFKPLVMSISVIFSSCLPSLLLIQ
jgi:magnesium-transporting ATPase (P-type)